MAPIDESEEETLFDHNKRRAMRASMCVDDDGTHSSSCRRMLGVLGKEVIKSKKKAVTPSSIPERGPCNHTWVHSMLRSHSHRWYAVWYKNIRAILVWISIISFVCESEVWFAQFDTFFNWFEGFISVFFLVEFFLKIFAAPERKEFDGESQEPPQDFAVAPATARFRYFFSFESFVDIMCFLPFFVEVSNGINPDKDQPIRCLRLIRFLKLDCVWKSIRLVMRVFYYNAEILACTLFVCWIMLLACSIALYYNRPPVELDPRDNFTSILNCLYLSILMLSGQGEPYGVMPWYTRIVISVTALFGLMQFMIPASMLTWGFEQEAEYNIKQKNEREKKAAQRCKDAIGQAQKEEVHLSSSSSDEEDRQQEWNGYLDQLDIGGDDEEEDEAQEGGDAQPSPESSGQSIGMQSFGLRQMIEKKDVSTTLNKTELKRAKAIFARLDDDGDGFLHWKMLRRLVKTDDQAQNLHETLRGFKDITGDEDDNICMQEFLAWLSYVKTNNKRYGDKVFLRILNHMEHAVYGSGKPEEQQQQQQQQQQGPMQRRRQRARGAGQTELSAAEIRRRADFVHSQKEVQQLAESEGPAGQLMNIAFGFNSLEKDNKQLEDKVKAMQKELAELNEDK